MLATQEPQQQIQPIQQIQQPQSTQQPQQNQLNQQSQINPLNSLNNLNQIKPKIPFQQSQQMLANPLKKKLLIQLKKENFHNIVFIIIQHNQNHHLIKQLKLFFLFFEYNF